MAQVQLKTQNKFCHSKVLKKGHLCSKISHKNTKIWTTDRCMLLSVAQPKF